jgi:hypothetical protein
MLVFPALMTSHVLARFDATMNHLEYRMVSTVTKLNRQPGRGKDTVRGESEIATRDVPSSTSLAKIVNFSLQFTATNFSDKHL